MQVGAVVPNIASKIEITQTACARFSEDVNVDVDAAVAAAIGTRGERLQEHFVNVEQQIGEVRCNRRPPERCLHGCVHVQWDAGGKTTMGLLCASVTLFPQAGGSGSPPT